MFRTPNERNLPRSSSGHGHMGVWDRISRKGLLQHNANSIAPALPETMHCDHKDSYCPRSYHRLTQEASTPATASGRPTGRSGTNCSMLPDSADRAGKRQSPTVHDTKLHSRISEQQPAIRQRVPWSTPVSSVRAGVAALPNLQLTHFIIIID